LDRLIATVGFGLAAMAAGMLVKRVTQNRREIVGQGVRFSAGVKDRGSEALGRTKQAATHLINELEDGPSSRDDPAEEPIPVKRTEAV
jgi:hypothetical protein